MVVMHAPSIVESITNTLISKEIVGIKASPTEQAPFYSSITANSGSDPTDMSVTHSSLPKRVNEVRPLQRHDFPFYRKMNSEELRVYRQSHSDELGSVDHKIIMSVIAQRQYREYLCC